MPQLFIINGQDKGKKIDFSQQLLIGRGTGVDWPLVDTSLSRRHCLFFQRDDGIVIKDLNSTNGVYVNSQRVVEEMPLKNGDQLRLGMVEMLFSETGKTNTVDSNIHSHVRSSDISGPDSTVYIPPESKRNSHSKNNNDLPFSSKSLSVIQSTPSLNATELDLVLWLEQLRLMFDMQRSALFLYNNERKSQQLIGFSSASGMGKQFSSEILNLASQGHSIVISNAPKDKNPTIRTASEEFGFLSLCQMPVVSSSGEIQGVLYLDSHSEQRNNIDEVFSVLRIICRLLIVETSAKNEEVIRDIHDDVPDLVLAPAIPADFPLEVCFKVETQNNPTNSFHPIQLAEGKSALVFFQRHISHPRESLIYIAGLLEGLNTKNLTIEEVAAYIYRYSNLWLNEQQDKAISLLIIAINPTTGDVELINNNYQVPWIKKTDKALQPFGMRLSAINASECVFEVQKSVLSHGDVLLVLNSGQMHAKDHLGKSVDISTMTKLINTGHNSALSIMNQLDPYLRTHSQGAMQCEDISLICLALE